MQGDCKQSLTLFAWEVACSCARHDKQGPQLERRMGGRGTCLKFSKTPPNIPGSVCANVFALTNFKSEQLLQYGAVTSNIFPLCITGVKFPLVHNRKFDMKIIFCLKRSAVMFKESWSCDQLVQKAYRHILHLKGTTRTLYFL